MQQGILAAGGLKQAVRISLGPLPLGLQTLGGLEPSSQRDLGRPSDTEVLMAAATARALFPNPRASCVSLQTF